MPSEQLIQRINQLARKKRECGLTTEEQDEQQRLRAQYLSEFRRDTSAMLERVRIVEADGSLTALTRKDDG